LIPAALRRGPRMAPPTPPPTSAARLRLPRLRAPRWRAFAVLTTLALAAPVAGITAATPAAAATTFTAKGPVGWDTLRHLDQFDSLPQGVQAKQFSSFDRAQHNGDQGNCLRSIGTGGCVMAETNGPGEITSIWFTGIATVNGANDFGNVSGMGNIVIVLD